VSYNSIIGRLTIAAPSLNQSIASNLNVQYSNYLNALILSNGFPDIPTVGETVPGFDASSWYGILAPAGTPLMVVNKIQNDISTALQTPEVKNFIINNGFDVIGNKPQEFTAVIQKDMEKWGRLLKSLNAS